MHVLPRTIIHADWSMAPRKRWAARADLRGDRRYVVEAPDLVTPTKILSATSDPSLLLGFDFPIGVPAAYAALAGVGSFTDLLPRLGHGEWSSFFDVAHTRSEIGLRRPFYPNAPGSKKREHLVEALGLRSDDDLYRACHVADGRRACPMFWTLGGNQVGKGAVTGWRDVLQPACATGRVDLWPFDGAFEELLGRDRTVIVETYPGDVYRYVGALVEGRLSKRVQASRTAAAKGVLAWAEKANVDLSRTLVEQLCDGFGCAGDGEDRFDAVVGLLGMLAVVREHRAVGIPSTRDVHRVEGWILGRAAQDEGAARVGSALD